MLGSGWTPAAVVLAATVAVLLRYGTPPRDIAAFAGYAILGLALPGTLLVRALYRGRRTLGEEIALGTALGYAVELPVYAAARAAGAPMLVAGWPLLTCAVFLLVPGLRRHWRAAPARRAPARWSWFLAAILLYLLASTALLSFRSTPLTWPALGTAQFDLPFNLGLVAELKHHLPPQTPTVAGEPLLYHWFFAAHLGAASWLTGTEPLVLLARLGMLPVAAVYVLLLGLLARRVTGSRAGGALGVLGALFLALPSLYANANGLVMFTGVPYLPFPSPSTTFGAMLFVPVVLLVTDLLAGRCAGRACWVLLAAFLAAVMGAKATYLPVLAAGLAAVAGLDLLRRRPPSRAVLGALGMTAGGLLFAQLVLFGGTRNGLVVVPLSVARRTWGMLAGLGGRTDLPLSAPVLGVTLIFAAGCAMAWCGVLGLLRRPAVARRPEVVLLLGMGAAGVAATLLLGTATGAFNQAYFYHAVTPYLAIMTALGFGVLLRRERIPAVAAACAAAGGLAAAVGIRVICGVRVPVPPGQGGLVFLPYLVLAAVAALAAGGMLALRERPRPWALLVAAAVGAGSLGAWQARVWLLAHPGAEPRMYQDHRPPPELVPGGALAVARWLRAHSGPGDVVATNVYCRWGVENPCDSRQYWLSALAERRVLVEGWTYATPNLARWRPGEILEHRPHWDRQRIALNDTVFADPTPAAVDRLRQEYRVRWLVADERYLPPGVHLGDVAGFRLRAGDWAVYQVPGPAS
ncbi:hypothetical protein Sru01_36760 [Sphaerisporangium rufum]|uniref:Uncharacterized protein n=1 Tax=Sphaerisporangium rufum TaxID=1381558 RepID=A0A919R335_9ACTN|nr:hypothetical protein [Sphaerisporangium rufum]GII78694.1 hypothetical protein Sru01_36760 [Sphaerisporangium rufum]